MDLVDIEKLLDDFELNEDQRDMVMQRQTEQSSIVRVPSTAPPTNDEVQPYSLAAIIATATTTATAPEPESELIKGRQIFIPEDPGGGGSGGGGGGIIIDHRETIPQIIRDFNYNNNNGGGGGGEDNQQNSDLNFPQQTQHSLSTSTSSTSSSSASPSPSSSSATTNQRNSNFVNVSNVFSSLHEYVNARIETAAETAETATKKTTKSTKIDDIDIEQNHHSIDSFHNQQQSQSQSQSQQQQFNSISSQSSSLSPTILTASQSASSQSAPQSQSSSDPYSNSLSSSSSSSILLSSFPHVTDPQLNKPLSTFIELSEETRTDFLEKNPKSSSLDNNRKLRKLTIKSKRNRCNLQMSTQNTTSTFVSTLDQNQLENLNNHVILKSECDKTLINNQNLQQYGIVNQSYSSSLDEDEEDDDDDVDDEDDNDLESSSGSSVSLSLSSPTAAAAAAADAEAEAATAATTSAVAESIPTSKIIESSNSQNITKTNLENSNLFIATKRKINKIPTIKCHHSQIDNCESKVPQKIPIKLIIKNHRRRERRRQQQQQQQLQQQRRQQSSQRKQLRRKIVPAVDSLIPLMEAAAAPKTTTTTTMTTENISIGNLNATKNNQSDDDDDDEKTTQKLNGNNQIKEIDIKNQLKEFIEQKPETASNELNAEHGKQTVIGFTSIATATGTTTMDDISDTELESYLQELELETATVAATATASATATEMSIDGGPLTNINEQWNVEHRRPIGDGQEEQMTTTTTTTNNGDDVDLDDDELNLTNLTTTTTTTTSSSSMSISVTEDPAELDDDDDEHREREFSLDLKLSTTTLSTSDCEHPQTSQNTHNDVKSAEVEIPNRHIDLMEIEKYHQNDKMAMANDNDSNSNNEIVKIPEITGMIGKTTTDEILENVVGMTASATTMAEMEATTMATMAKDEDEEKEEQNEKLIIKETEKSSNPIQMKQADADDSETTPAAVAAVAVAGTTTSSSSSSSSLSLSIDSQPSESESTTAPLDTDCISSDTNENNIDSTAPAAAAASATSATIPSPSPSQSSPSQHPIPLSSILMRPTNAHQQLGKIQPYWIPDNVTNFCMQCNLKFSLIKRRHHCRACGQVLCSTCCSLKARLPYLDDCEARVCIQCDIILHDRDSTDDALLMLDGDGAGSGSGSGSGNIGSGSTLGNDGNDSLNNLIISGGGSNLNCALDSFGNPIREENDRVRAVNSKFITPNPKNPMEYCSKIPPSQQQQQQQQSAAAASAASASSSSSSSGQSAIKSPISVMVPVGVLKKRTPATISATTSSSSSSSGSSSSSSAVATVSGLGSSGAGAGAVAPPIRKNVMFSDGIRPGCDLTDLDTNWDRIVSTSTSTSTSTSMSTSNKIGMASGSGMTINGNSSSTTTTTTKIATASASTVSATIPSSSTSSTISRVFKQSVGGVTVNNGNGGGAGSINTNTNKIKLPVIDSTTKSFIPKGGLTNFQLPPIYQQHSPIKYTFVDIENDEQLLSRLTDETLTFAIQRNFYVLVRIVKLTCCINKTVINFTTQGLHHVGQDEIVILLDMQQPTTSHTSQSDTDDSVPLTTTALPNAPTFKRLPKEIFLHLNDIYLEADKGNSIGELGFSLVGNSAGIGSITGNHSTGNSTGINGGGGQEFLDSKEHGGFLYIRSTFQCLQNIIVPESPFLIGLLLHRWEIPWAKIFPLRLMLRLGALYRYYPCPHVSVLARNSVYAEIAQTIINFLADFRTYSYTVPSIHGMYIHMESRCTTVLIPKNRYDQIMKAINDSSDHILALGGNFSKKADGHLVCIQNTEAGCPETHSYSTQAINIHGQPRKVTGASFILLNGALKTASGLSGKCSIVEDGLMVQILPAKMITIRKSLKAMENVEIVCGPSDAVDPEQTETVNFKWIENDTDFNVGVISPIDKKPMDGIPCIRVHHGMDYSNSNHLIRWTEVFIIKADDESVHGRDPIDIPKLSEQIAKSTSIALVLFLDLLAASGFRKIGLRTTFDQDNVCYEAGSQFNKLAPLYMNALDNELIPTLHSQATNLNLDTPITIELIFHILNE